MSSLTFQSTARLSSGISTSDSKKEILTGNTHSHTGYEIPLLGFGVAFGFGKEEDVAVITKPSLLEALRVGYRYVRSIYMIVLSFTNVLLPKYRHVDTAEMYHNEKEAGEAIRESGVPRSELFISAFEIMILSVLLLNDTCFAADKVPDYEGTYEKALTCIDNSLKVMGVSKSSKH